MDALMDLPRAETGILITLGCIRLRGCLRWAIGPAMGPAAVRDSLKVLFFVFEGDRPPTLPFPDPGPDPDGGGPGCEEGLDTL
jgi:hypothetical protein